jgi:hypothetical protein
MPSAHRRHAEWTPERLQRQARDIGPHSLRIRKRIEMV